MAVNSLRTILFFLSFSSCSLSLSVFFFSHRHHTFRLAAIDHGMFSFVDQSLDDGWPIVLTTTPKDARWLLAKEPLGVLTQCKHIRTLVYSVHNITSVSVSIDGAAPQEMSAVGSAGLYTAPWNPASYRLAPFVVFCGACWWH